MQQIGRNAVLCGDGVEPFRGIGILRVQAGEVDGRPHDGQTALYPLGQKTADLTAHEQIQFDDRAVALHQGQEFIGRNEFTVFTLPSDERFGAVYLARSEVDFRL